MRVLKAHFSERYYENYESHSHPVTPQTKSSCIIRLHSSLTSVKIVYKTSCEHSMKNTACKHNREKTKQRLAFPVYDEEDILDWNAAIITPPPRPSGTIRVRLIYKGRRKPMPVENPWAHGNQKRGDK